MENAPQKKKFLDSNYSYFLIGFTIGMLILIVYGTYKTNQNNKSKNIDNNSSEISEVVLPKIPDNLNFAGESVPMYNFEVKERVQREFLVNTYWHASTILALKRANRWFPVIEPILKRYNIPDDFKYVPVAESNLTNAVSSAGAVGYWQFTEEVAKKFGLEVNNQVDERYNIEKSTEAACRYFQAAHKEFNNWTLAAASFNMGTNGLEKQLNKQKASNYYNLVLSDETSRYIPRIIAFKQILTNPEEYGYYLKSDELYKPLKTFNVEVKSPVKDWADFAINHGINYKILKFYNPWLRDISLKNTSNKTYSIEIPEKGSIEIVKDE